MKSTIYRLFIFLTALVSICVLAIACSRADTTDRRASIDFLAGGTEFRKFRNSYDLRVSELVDACLRRAGFDPTAFATNAPPPVPTVAPEAQNYYGIVDNLRLRQAHDELMLQTLATIPPVPSEEQKEYDEALDGTAEEPGCSQEARTIADTEFRISEVQAISSIIAEMGVDSGVADAYRERVDEWALCMRKQGIDGISHPHDISARVSEQWHQDANEPDQSDRALQLERSIFLAEQECPSLTGESPLEQSAEQILETNPDVDALLSQVLSD